MLKKIIIFCVMLAITTTVSAGKVQINPDHPDKYIVVKGDTLWDISGRFLQEPWKWPEIWDINPEIENPHLIFPGDVIALRYVDGELVLGVVTDADAGEGGEGIAVVGEENVQQQRSRAGRDIKLSPKARSYKREEAIDLIPIDAIQQFLVMPLIIDEEDYDGLPYVVAGNEGRQLSERGDKVYIRGLSKKLDGVAYSVYRKGQPYLDPDNNNKLLGIEAIHVADLRITKNEDVATALITSIQREVKVGDRLIPLDDEIVSSAFIPKRIDRDIQGRIISVFDGVSQIGQYDIVVLNLGKSQGIEIGNILAIYQNNGPIEDKVRVNVDSNFRRIKFKHEESSIVDNIFSNIYNDIRKTRYDIDRKLGASDSFGYEKVEIPDEYAGVIMVFRTFKDISYAMVMEAGKAVHVKDKVKNL